MSGFDNGTVQQGVFAQTKQFGPVLLGTGEPVPSAGVVGDVYVDTQTQFLYIKRSNSEVSPWGNYLFAVPVTYSSCVLNWFSSAHPTNDLGANGDHLPALPGVPGIRITGYKAVHSWDRRRLVRVAR